ncbi:MAG: phospholipase [Micavibrio aeruginosavorus]|uniref:Phospholipase n=1 Tax=Micavibrio aeruginosavorus TaxID=349221 RepID=A0A2W5FK06_9BACT|nr:MAG: phospholipase [Micavibrio aeruginosavorus]
MEKDFKHIFIQGDASQPVLLLLHGTGGDEQDLVELGQAVSPASTILSVRGKVLENGMPRFFRRLAEGVFDLEDLKFRTDELADFIADARTRYGFGNQPVFALGYSNGANIAASLLLARAEALQGAVLLRAMVPFEPESLPDLKGKNILMLSGLMDPIIPADNSQKLATMLQHAGAKVDIKMKPTGHGLTQSDFSDIKNWMVQEIVS